MSGVFIVFEGGDGVGKSTQVRLLADALTAAGHRVVLTHEPGDTPVGHDIRRILLDPATGDLSPRAEALLYAADKAQHLFEVVEPALARGEVVVCDRYVDSMLAYQGAGRVLDLADVERVARWATADVRPDLTVLLDLDPADAMGDIAELDRVEAAGLEFHRRARELFVELARRDPSRFLVLPAREPVEQLAAQIWTRVQSVLSDPSASMSS